MPKCIRKFFRTCPLGRQEVKLFGRTRGVVALGADSRLFLEPVHECNANEGPAGRIAGLASSPPTAMLSAHNFPGFLPLLVGRDGASGWAWAEELTTVAASLPETLRQLLERQGEPRAVEDERLLEAASMVGAECAVAAVAAALPGVSTKSRSGA